MFLEVDNHLKQVAFEEIFSENWDTLIWRNLCLLYLFKLDIFTYLTCLEILIVYNY